LLAHRGGRGPWRENTIEAFKGALAQGADGVELDVRRSADGSLVLHHDAVVPGLGPLHELRNDDLPAWIPTLEQALSACAGAMVNVEVKNSPLDPGHDPDETVAGEVLEIIAAGRERGPEAFPSTLQISSFSPATISALASARSGVPLGLLVAPALSSHDALVGATRLGCSTLNVFHSQVTADLVATARDQGIGVVAWTVNERAQVASMLEAGVEAVISDDVPGALEVMRAAGYKGAPKTPAPDGGPEGGLVRDGSPRGQSMA